MIIKIGGVYSEDGTKEKSYYVEVDKEQFNFFDWLMKHNAFRPEVYYEEVDAITLY